MTGRSSTRVLFLLGNARLNGQERGNIEVARTLKASGADVLVVTNAVWGHAHVQPFLDELDIDWAPLKYAFHFRKGMTVLAVAKNTARLISASWTFSRIAHRFKPSHIHACNPHYVLSVLPALMMRRTPLVYRLGDEPTEHNRFYRTLWRRFIVPRVYTFVCNSQFIKRRLLATGAPEIKTRVIISAPSVRPPQASSDLPTDLRAERLGTTPSFAGRTIVYMGQMSEHKGVHLLVDAALRICAERADVRFLIAGTSTSHDGFATRLAAQVLAARRTDRIRFLGYVADIDGLLSISDIHCAPSVWEEPLANVVLEAKRAGVPSVIFASGGLPELVTEPGLDCVIATDKTVDALREALLHYIDMPDLTPAKDSARTSLSRLNATPEAFAAAWSIVYGLSTADLEIGTIPQPFREVAA